MHILVTGGTGYLGSHTAVALIGAGHEVTIVDDLSNSTADVPTRMARIVGRAVPFHQVDLRDAARLADVFAAARVDAVIHFAGLKAVSDSVRRPLSYYDNNVNGATTLLNTMRANGVFTLVFSSSAAVYGAAAESPVREESPAAPSSPYGHTKAMIECILRDVAAADDRWRVAVLRYFNPVGSHPSGLIGDDPRGEASNLVPLLARVALGRQPFVPVFGDDYPTPDGTGLRDYIHVEDLVAGHLAALDALGSGRWPLREWNLGTGVPSSVLEMVRAFGGVAGRELPYRIEPRRPGDVPAMYADPARSLEELDWRATRTVLDMCTDAWRWYSGVRA